LYSTGTPPPYFLGVEEGGVPKYNVNHPNARI